MGFVVKITTKKMSRESCRNLAEEFFGTHLTKKEKPILNSPGRISILFENSEHAKQFLRVIEQIERD